jgi:serine/threonine-protein kinase
MSHPACACCGIELPEAETDFGNPLLCSSCRYRTTLPDALAPSPNPPTLGQPDESVTRFEPSPHLVPTAAVDAREHDPDYTVWYVAVRADGSVDPGIPDRNDVRLMPLKGRTALQGRYFLESELGRGGFGIVYLGRDGRLDRPVAVKVMLPARPAMTASERQKLTAMFADEARLGANLINPAIATVFDYGFHEQLPYTVFEYVPGETLRDLLARRSVLPLEEVFLFLGPVAQALDVAHARRVVHRDLKPENIRVTKQGQFKILDLGLAREFDRHDDWRFAGTPAYASPEQAAELPSDGRSDQYALAVIVYEMLTGRRPFTDRNPRVLLEKHRDTDPPHPRSLAPELPDHVADALLRALSKDPNNRFGTCQDFAAAVGCRFVIDVPEPPEILYEARARQPVEPLSIRGALRLLEAGVGRGLGRLIDLAIVGFLLVVFARLSPIFVRFIPTRFNLITIFVVLGVLGVVSLVRRKTLRDRVWLHVLLASDAIWTNLGGEIRRWPLAAINRVHTPTGRARTLEVRFRTSSGDDTVQEFQFPRADDYVRFSNRLRARIKEGAKNPGTAESLVDWKRRVVLIERHPGVRYQVLAPISVEHAARYDREARAELRAAMIDADAVIDVRTETRYLLNKTVGRLTGVAVRATDAAGRFDLLVHWLSERTADAGTRMLVLNALAAIVLAAEYVLMSQMSRLGTFLLLFITLLSYAWPIALAVALRWRRRPRLLSAAALACLGWGLAPLFGRFLCAYFLSEPERGTGEILLTIDRWSLGNFVFGMTPRPIPADVRATLLNPIQLIIALVFMVLYLLLAGRIWRVRADYRMVQTSAPAAEKNAVRSLLEPLSTLASILLAVVLVAIPGLVLAATRAWR